jgi:uncharacterized small protein (DUF1192 family)
LGKADITGKGPAKEALDIGWMDELEERIGGLEKVVERTSELAINGKDVMEVLGIRAGRMVGEVLRKLMDVVTEAPERNNREELIGIVRGWRV